MGNSLKRILVAILLFGAIALVFLYREQLDSATIEAWVADGDRALPPLGLGAIKNWASRWRQGRAVDARCGGGGLALRGLHAGKGPRAEHPGACRALA